MIIFKHGYVCDAGSLLIGDRKFQAHISNGYGDGCHKVYVTDGHIEETRGAESKWRFLTDISGEFNVYYYDCYRDEELEKNINILIKLNGWYGVYNKNGDVLLERWGDKR